MQQTCKFVLMGLDCANCALKIEDSIKKAHGIKDVSVNFSNKSMVVEFDHDNRTLIKSIRETVNRIEPEVTVIECDREGSEGKAIVERSLKWEWIRLSLGFIPFALALLMGFSNWLKLILFLTSYIIIGVKVLKKAIINIVRGQIFDENFLMGIATLGAFIIGQYPEGVAVLLFYEVGELFQDMAVNRSRKSIADLMDIRPDYANLKKGDETIVVSPLEVQPGDIIAIRPGEKVPMDGYIIEGESAMDTSALTGESIPRDVKAGDEILGGFINASGLLWAEVSRPFEESTVSKILDLVENAGGKKAPTEKFITRFARYYTPVVVFLAAAIATIPPLLMASENFSDWVYRALVFLVISCPCALVISIPLGFFGGIGGASKKGILVKGGNFLEAMTDIDTVIFDKTGTLTKGVFAVTQINPVPGVGEADLLHYAALAETHSTHPIAISILRAYSGKIDGNQIEDYKEIPGLGITVKTREYVILAGNEGLMKSNDIKYRSTNALGTIVYIAVDGKYMGNIVVSDELKKDAKMAVTRLKGLGVKSLVMLTGDSRKVGEKVAEDLGLDGVYAQLLPHEKVEKLESIEKNKTTGGRLVFVGDGINDAPVLARADVGIAMGGLGSDAAIEAADIVLMTDEPHKLAEAIQISRKTKKIVWQNIVLALSVKGIVLLMGAMGIATMWEAVFADVGVALLAVLNSMRAVR